MRSCRQSRYLDLRHIVGVCICRRARYGVTKEIRPAAGNARFARPANRGPRAAARICDRAAAEADVPGRGAGDAGHAVSGAAPAREPRVDGGRLEDVRHRPRGQVLSPDAEGPRLPRKRSRELGAPDRRRRGDPQCRERRGIMTWWRRLIGRDRLEDQLDAELRDHFERLVADYRQQGHADGDARRLARLDFGGFDQVKEVCRDVRGTQWIEETAQDIRHAARGFLKTPGFTAVAVVTLALGIGANLAIFNVLDALLLRPLPVPNAQRLVTLTRWIENSSSESFSYPQIRALADRQDLFASLCGMGGATLFTGPPDGVGPVGAAFVSGKYFETLGLAPFMGRLLSAEDDQPGAAPVVVITHSYWWRRFAGDTSIVGRTMLIEGQQVPIVGVTPPGFEGAMIGHRADVTAAVHAQAKLQPEDDGGTSADQRWLLVLAVPAPTLTRDQLQARLDVAWRQLLEATTPTRLSADARRRALSMTVSVANGANGTSRLRGPMRMPLMVAYALVTLVLLIACVNVANLLLARGAARAREIALRLALGAGRSRILRQLLVESAMLAAAGSAVGVWIAWFGSDAIADVIVARSAGPDASEAVLAVAPNARVFGVTALIAAATTLIFGIVPAWRASVTAPGVAANGGRVAESHGRLASALISAP